MADANKPLAWLPGFLIIVGLLSLIAGLLTDGPDRVGGIVFGIVSLAAAAAILHRNARDAAEAQMKRGSSESTDPPDHGGM